jgi:hypothetical protein
MSAQDASTRQDLINNGVERELLAIREDLGAAQEIGAAVESELEHDLLVWPREYLETYLDSGREGAVPLSQVELQDLLEAAFDRDRELIGSAADTVQAQQRRAAEQEPAPTNRISEQPRISHALTDSGIYTGRIVAETSDLVVQQISVASEIVHRKDLFAQVPQVGQLVRIAYHDNVATVREIAERAFERELAR